MVCQETTDNFDMLDYVGVCIKSPVPHRFQRRLSFESFSTLEFTEIHVTAV